MKILKIVLPILLLSLALLIWLLPIGPMPGFFIGGTVTDVPENWGDTSSIHEVRLKASSGLLPRVVIIWVIQVEGDLHVVGAKDSGWVSMLSQGGTALVRMGDETYALQASETTQDFELILQAYIDKYRADYPDIIDGFPSLEEAKGTVAVFRLSRE